MPVPNHIRRLRSAHGISATQLAHTLGVNQSTLSRWESGDREVSDDGKLQVAEYFNLPVVAIFNFGYDPLRDALLRTMDAVTALRHEVDELRLERSV